MPNCAGCGPGSVLLSPSDGAGPDGGGTGSLVSVFFSLSIKVALSAGRIAGSFLTLSATVLSMSLLMADLVELRSFYKLAPATPAMVGY